MQCGIVWEEEPQGGAERAAPGGQVGRMWWQPRRPASAERWGETAPGGRVHRSLCRRRQGRRDGRGDGRFFSRVTEKLQTRYVSFAKDYVCNRLKSYNTIKIFQPQFLGVKEQLEIFFKHYLGLWGLFWFFLLQVFFLPCILFPESLIQCDNSGKSTVLANNILTVNTKENKIMYLNLENSPSFLTCPFSPCVSLLPSA